jgi:hypothetical protein
MEQPCFPGVSSQSFDDDVFLANFLAKCSSFLSQSDSISARQRKLDYLHKIMNSFSDSSSPIFPITTINSQSDITTSISQIDLPKPDAPTNFQCVSEPSKISASISSNLEIPLISATQPNSWVKSTEFSLVSPNFTFFDSRYGSSVFSPSSDDIFPTDFTSTHFELAVHLNSTILAYLFQTASFSPTIMTTSSRTFLEFFNQTLLRFLDLSNLPHIFRIFLIF